MPTRAPAVTLLLAGLLLASPPARAGEEPEPLPEGTSAFRLRIEPQAVRHAVPLDEVLQGVRGGDPRDRIPAVLEPRFVPVAEAYVPSPATRVIAVVRDGEARAYPLYVLDRHELVNDRIGDRAFLVTWCPLCGASVVFDREVAGHVLTFGVSGYLYQSDVLVYDHQTESFWSQIPGEAVVGPFTGRALRALPSSVMTWAAFRARHPEGRVLAEGQAGLPRAAYRGDAYAPYRRSPRLWFPVSHQSDALPAKAEVVGWVRGGRARCWPLAALAEAGGPVRDALAGATLTLSYDAEADEVTLRDAEGAPLPALRCYWFAWFAFHPETEVWTP